MSALRGKADNRWSGFNQGWTGYHVQFRASVLGQMADGSIDVTDRHVLLTLAWAAEPLIVKERGSSTLID
jgi:hypothetical protein